MSYRTLLILRSDYVSFIFVSFIAAPVEHTTKVRPKINSNEKIMYFSLVELQVNMFR